MRKAVISNRIYMTVDSSLLRDIQEELTYSIPGNMPGAEIVIKNYSVIKHDMPDGRKLISLPSGRMDLIPKDHIIEDNRLSVPVSMNVVKGFEPRDAQLQYLEYCESIGYSSHMLNAKPGWGKTIGCLLMLAKLGQKTLIVTHTVALRNQWEKEIVRVLGFKPGVIGSGKFNIDAPIVVANSQSLNKHASEVKFAFGAIVLDEMHHVASPTLSKCIDVMFSKVKIGLSATLRRKDGRHVVFQDYFSHNIYIPPKENTMDPIIEVWNPPISIPSGDHWAHRVTKLGNDFYFQELIKQLANHYVKLGHKVLIIYDKPAVLDALHKNSSNKGAVIHGETSELDRENIIQSMNDGLIEELYGSTKILTEGISINPLSCLILGQPINNEINIEQLAGRINRLYPGKPTPIIADIRFQGHTGWNQFITRERYYRQEGLIIRFM